MNLTVKPTSSLNGSIVLPSSKSYTIRSFIIAACGGTSNIVNASMSDDTRVAKSVAGKLGAEVSKINNHSWRVKAMVREPNLSKVDVKESGTVLRFSLPLVSHFSHHSLVTGQGTLRGRPNHLLTKTLRQMGVRIKGYGRRECIPIRLKGGKLTGGDLDIDGSLSSQFISALLITAPLLDENTRLRLKGKKIISSDYITMTLNVLKVSGIKVKQIGRRQFTIKGNQKFCGLGRFVIPSDYGLAAFLMVAAVLTKSNVTLKGHLPNDFIQADGAIISILRRMGANIVKTKNAIKIKGPSTLKGGSFSLKDAPDLVPIVSVLALFAKGRTRLYDIGHVRSKESNRISDLKRELKKIGANVIERKNELVIKPKDYYKNNCVLDPHQDHRLAMSFCVLGLKVGVRVKDIECCRKSYPEFVCDFKKLGARTKA